MSFVSVICVCAACKTLVECNPLTVPSVRVDGVKVPLCRDCAEVWNQMHRVSKGLPPIPIAPDAYTGCDENELPDE